jgi:hypothetical protein
MRAFCLDWEIWQTPSAKFAARAKPSGTPHSSEEQFSNSVWQIVGSANIASAGVDCADTVCRIRRAAGNCILAAHFSALRLVITAVDGLRSQ